MQEANSEVLTDTHSRSRNSKRTTLAGGAPGYNHNLVGGYKKNLKVPQTNEDFRSNFNCWFWGQFWTTLLTEDGNVQVGRWLNPFTTIFFFKVELWDVPRVVKGLKEFSFAIPMRSSNKLALRLFRMYLLQFGGRLRSIKVNWVVELGGCISSHRYNPAIMYEASKWFDDGSFLVW